MKRGRKPKPKSLKDLQGNPGRRPARAKASVSAGPVAAPKHLDSAALEEWKRVVPLLSPLDLITAESRAALAAYCQAYSRWAAAEVQLRAEGLIVDSPNGYPMQSPYLAIATGAMKQMLAIMTEFGMTPSSRARVGGEPPAAADPLDEFLSTTAPQHGQKEKR